MADDSDWRLMGQEKYLQGVSLHHRRYRRPLNNPDWDHDHCEFCWAKLMVEDYPEVLHQGYCTQDEYYWICDECFRDFKSRFNWTVREETNS
jgi:hypothetical protein